MRSRAIVFASLVLLVAPLSLPSRHGHGRCRKHHRPGTHHLDRHAAEAAPQLSPESPLERLGR